MTKKIKINNVEVSIEDFKKAMEENKELLEKKDRRVEGETYWVVDSWGEIIREEDRFTDRHNYRYLIGNYFLSEQEAKNHKAYLEALGRVRLAIKEANDGWKPNWKDLNSGKYYIYFDNDFDELKVGSAFASQDTLVTGYICSDDIADRIIENHEDDLLLIFNYKQ